MPDGTPYAEALARYRIDEPRAQREEDLQREELLRRYHPDYREGATVSLEVGANRGDPCQHELAGVLQANARIDEVDLAGAPVTETDVVIVGSGGAGCAAALSAANSGARVVLVNKLRLGDSNTVMAEGGIQACIGSDDTPQLHYDDTLRGGHFRADRKLVAQMVMDGPEVIRWLIQQGMQFDQEPDSQLTGGNLLLKTPGGASRPRILSFKDYTGLEMMRVLRAAVSNHPRITVWNRTPVVELLSNDQGDCAGCVAYWLQNRAYTLVHAPAVILATGGIGRMHLNGFPTSNHFGAMGDGLVLAYRLGAQLRDMNAFQYHPTGLAHPQHKLGALVSEAARSMGAQLLNGRGVRFVDELKPRDHVSAAIIRECEEGRGIQADKGTEGVFLDIPTLVRQQPGILAQFGSLVNLAERCAIDPSQTPFLVYPTLHYQNGGVVIDGDGATTVPGLYCAGELSGGIHGTNRLMGNALLDILSFGRRAGAAAAGRRGVGRQQRISIDHVHQWQRQLTLAGRPLNVKAPALFPEYANFERQEEPLAGADESSGQG
jgi:succinate dehydrogenase / fumarate reductase flavoprotein subunit/L-aspartate oxidase